MTGGSSWQNARKTTGPKTAPKTQKAISLRLYVIVFQYFISRSENVGYVQHFATI